jgi:hypothetical protein
LAFARSLAVVERKSTAYQNGEPFTSFYITNHSIESGCAKQLSQLIRGHWSGSEILNHWIRDALWGEDKTRSKNFNLNANLAILRCGLIALKSFLAPDTPWPILMERCQHNTSIAYQMVVNHSFK